MWKRIFTVTALLTIAVFIGGCAPGYTVDNAVTEVIAAYEKLCAVENLEMNCNVLLTSPQGTVNDRQQILADFAAGTWYSMEQSNESLLQEKFYNGEMVYVRGPEEDFKENPGLGSEVPQWENISGLLGTDKSFAEAVKTERNGFVELELKLSAEELEKYKIVEGTVCTEGKINYTIDENGVLTGCTISAAAESETAPDDMEPQGAAMATVFQVIRYNDESISEQLKEHIKQ